MTIDENLGSLRVASPVWRAVALCFVVVSVVLGAMPVAEAALPLDLGARYPDAPSICMAMAPMKSRDFDAIVGKSALVESSARNVADLRTELGQLAWGEATTIRYSIDTYVRDRLPFRAYRVALWNGQPAVWVYEATDGYESDTLLWVFQGGNDASKPGHLLAQFGKDGSGPFTTRFVRFHAQPYVVNRWRWADGNWSISVNALEPQREVCSFGSRALAQR